MSMPGAQAYPANAMPVQPAQWAMPAPQAAFGSALAPVMPAQATQAPMMQAPPTYVGQPAMARGFNDIAGRQAIMGPPGAEAYPANAMPAQPAQWATPASQAAFGPGPAPAMMVMQAPPAYVGQPAMAQGAQRQPVVGLPAVQAYPANAMPVQAEQWSTPASQAAFGPVQQGGMVLPAQTMPTPAAQAPIMPARYFVGQPAMARGVNDMAEWRPLDAENTVVFETALGRIIVELQPQFAPLGVARIKRLTRTKVYDGLLFHRVIEGFIAQSGNPNNQDGGKSDEPNLPPEFTFRLGAEAPRMVAARPQGETHGFIGSAPYVSVEDPRMAMSPDRRVSAWGAFCAGAMGMGHDESPDSANSEFFFMRQTTRSLDRAYSVVGRVVFGLDIVRALNAGDPPRSPEKITRARVLADMPDGERPRIWVMNTLGPQFVGLVEQIRAARGADFSICDVDVPVRIDALPSLTPKTPKGRGRSRDPRRP